MTFQKLGILGAMASEVELLTETMAKTEPIEVAGLRFYDGALAGVPVVVVQGGVGKVCAASCTQILIDRFGVDAIVNTGVAGGLHPALAIGDLVIAEDAIQHDFDLTAFGHARGYLPAGGGDDRAPTRFAADPALTALFCAAADRVHAADPAAFGQYLRGTVVSGDIFVDSTPLKRELIAQFGAAAAEMEGAAIAQVATANRVPFAIVRAISDLAEQQATVSFDEFERRAAALSCRILLDMLTHM